MIDPATRVWLAGIRQEITAVHHYTEDANSGTLAAWPMRKAMQHSLTIIAEAVRQLPADLKAKRPDLPWNRIDALDSLLGHEMGREDTGESWSRIVDHLEDLDEMAESLLGADARPESGAAGNPA